MGQQVEPASQKPHPVAKPQQHKRQTPKIEVIVGPVTKSVSTSITRHQVNEHKSRNERIGRGENLEERQGNQFESLKNLVSNLESNEGELNSNEKWFNRIRRRITLSNRNANRRRLVPIDEETYEDDDQDDIVNSVVTNVLKNNRRRIDLSDNDDSLTEDGEDDFEDNAYLEEE